MPLAIELAHCGLLEQCLLQALHYLVSDDADFIGAAVLDFRPDLISIQDRGGQTVLAGIVQQNTLTWLPPYRTDDERLIAKAQIQRRLKPSRKAVGTTTAPPRTCGDRLTISKPALSRTAGSLTY